jgi:hypothetical protein
LLPRSTTCIRCKRAAISSRRSLSFSQGAVPRLDPTGDAQYHGRSDRKGPRARIEGSESGAGWTTGRAHPSGATWQRTSCEGSSACCRARLPPRPHWAPSESPGTSSRLSSVCGARRRSSTARPVARKRRSSRARVRREVPGTREPIAGDGSVRERELNLCTRARELRRLRATSEPSIERTGQRPRCERGGRGRIGRRASRREPQAGSLGAQCGRGRLARILAVDRCARSRVRRVAQDGRKRASSSTKSLRACIVCR